MRDSVTVHMAAPPERVWDLVSDITKIGSYSPETFEAEWLEGATGPAVGAYNEEVYAELLGYDATHLDELRAAGII